MRLSALGAFLLGGLSLLACNDSESIDPTVHIATDGIYVNWSGPGVHSITLGESRGPQADAECDPGRNVWWARQSSADETSQLRAPFRIGDTPSGVSVGGTPLLEEGKRYIVRVDRNESGSFERAQGCIGFTR